MLRLRLALPLVRRRLLDLRVRLGACACSTLLAQDDTAGGRNHGIVYANGIFSREHHAKLLATSGATYKGFGLVCANGLFSSGAPSEVACNFRTLPRLGACFGKNRCRDHGLPSYPVGATLRGRPEYNRPALASPSMHRPRNLSQPRRGGACVKSNMVYKL